MSTKKTFKPCFKPKCLTHSRRNKREISYLVGHSVAQPMKSKGSSSFGTGKEK